jgi:hypothetical protein
MPHLLLVDDDEDILSLLTNFFRNHSHVVSVAENGVAMFAALVPAAARSVPGTGYHAHRHGGPYGSRRRPRTGGG